MLERKSTREPRDNFQGLIVFRNTLMLPRVCDCQQILCGFLEQSECCTCRPVGFGARLINLYPCVCNQQAFTRSVLRSTAARLTAARPVTAIRTMAGDSHGSERGYDKYMLEFEHEVHERGQTTKQLGLYLNEPHINR